MLPPSRAASLGLQELRTQHGGWIASAALIAGAAAVVQFGAHEWAQRRLRARQEQEQLDARTAALQQLATVTAEEAAILLEALNTNCRTVHRKFHDATAQGLKSKGLVEVPGGMAYIMIWPYTVPSFVWDHLKANRDEVLEALKARMVPRAQ